MQFDIRRFDIYRKVPKDLTQPTLTGAIISISSCLFMLFLFISELKEYLTVDVSEHIQKFLYLREYKSVMATVDFGEHFSPLVHASIVEHSVLTVDDPVKHSEKLPVFINITLPNLACHYVGLDIQDDMGRHEVGFRDNTIKEAINEEKGCRFESHFLINKVPGNFHISTHSSHQQPEEPDMTHIIHKLRFGMDLESGKDVEGSFNPLKDVDRTGANALATHDYILRVVPTVYEDKRGNIRYPFQYTYSYRDMMQMGHGGRMMPAIWFRYELSPITVRYVEKSKPFYTFLVMVCAIIGGTFTVAGIIDSLIFSAAEIVKKLEIGKLS